MRDVFRLGIDLGTTNTVAALQWPDGSVRPLLFDGSPTLPSAVCVGADGSLVVGQDAVREGRVRPENFEANPKRCIDDVRVLLGDREVPVVDLLAAVLGRVADEARRVAGAPCAEIVLTYPTTWGQRRRDQMLAAAGAVGLHPVRMVPEPVAAAAWFAQHGPKSLASDAAIVVYDFGAGTFDASAVRRARDGFVVLAEEGLRETGGLDIDAAVIGYLGAVFGAKHPQAWQRLTAPATSQDRRARRALWDDVRAAKETLSRTSSTEIHLPLVDEIALLGREHLDALARPIVERTAATTDAVIRAAGLRPDTVAAVFLVGGSSRMPLAATLLHQRLGVAGTVLEQPELVVAQGSLLSLAAVPDQAPSPLPPFPLPSVISVPPSPLAPADPPADRATIAPVQPATPAPASPPGSGQVPDTMVPAPSDGGASHPTAAPFGSAPSAPVPPPVAPVPPPVAPVPPPAAPARGGRDRSRRVAAAVAAATVVVVVVAIVAVVSWWPDAGGRGTGAPPSSSGAATSHLPTAGAGCAGASDTALVLLADDKFLQKSDNVVPVLYRPIASAAAIAALDRVSDALDTTIMVGLNKAVEVDRRTPEAVAVEFATRVRLTEGIARNSSGSLIVGAAGFSENQILANLYRIALTAAGYSVSVRAVGNREVFAAELESGAVHVVPDYAATLAEFLNTRANGATAKPVASGQIATTMDELRKLGDQRGLVFGKASKANDQIGFAVTRSFAARYGVQTLSQFAATCTGSATILGGPKECPTRDFCQPGLESTYGIRFGGFTPLDAGGPQTKNALHNGTVSIAQVFTSDAALA